MAKTIVLAAIILCLDPHKALDFLPFWIFGLSQKYFERNFFFYFYNLHNVVCQMIVVHFKLLTNPKQPLLWAGAKPTTR